MTRRDALLAVPAVATLAALAPADPPDLRAVHKWTARGCERCRMYDLRPNDVFWLEDVGVMRAEGMPFRRPEDDRWTIVATSPGVDGEPWVPNAPPPA